VLPNIPESARKTITGRIRVNVRVRVDRAGNVDNASLERPRASRYLSGRVLAAAKAWKFPPGNAPQDWVLRFELTRQQTVASASKIGN
jgi:TonB family protein